MTTAPPQAVRSVEPTISSTPTDSKPSLAFVILVPLLFAIGGILGSLLLVEVVFRIFISGSTAPKWRDRPASYFISEKSETFQDYAHSVIKAPNTYRIAVIGDSFTFAPYMQFDDAFPKRLERWLNLNEGQKKVEVINYGVPAYSTNHEVRVVERAIKEQADLILMQITLNDPEIKPYTPQELFREKNKFGDLEIENPILKHWKSAAFLLKRLHNRQTRKSYQQKFFDLFNKEATWNNFSTSWTKISVTVKDAKVPLVATIFPLFGMPVDSSYPFWPIDEKVGNLLNSLEVPYLDITSIYADIPVERLQVLPGEDFHPNEIAHRMAAEAILNWLESNKLIPMELFPKAHSIERVGIKKPARS